MRRTLSGLLLVIAFFGSAAWPKHRTEQRGPIFMAPGFSFGQIDTVCLAPPIDLRSDKTNPLYGGLGTAPADVALAKCFNRIGYPTVGCNPITATLDDLKSPSDAWLNKLDFGTSRWLFILYIEYFEPASYWKFSGSRRGVPAGAENAVVSGCLFGKEGAGAKLLWRDRVVGTPSIAPVEGTSVVPGFEVQVYESGHSINTGIETLLAKFEPRGRWKGLRTPPTHTEDFDVACDVLWRTLNQVLKDSGRYDVMQTDDTDRMASYTIKHSKSPWTVSAEFASDAILRPSGSGCSMEITPAPSRAAAAGAGDAKSLFHRVRESLSR